MARSGLFSHDCYNIFIINVIDCDQMYKKVSKCDLSQILYNSSKNTRTQNTLSYNNL
ncbi:protein of unknown function [Vibrio tapetis subsp. tapetis]|uniref:Uncharacterized protein n=1 Tax=Vibrio tapetis subsp. tapetis TaxID=1671868 RepID=A0A2N8ZKF6_9VIBR|nr:protein of unknown function [Vibrio tapetis subsp. tapetis]